MDLISQLPEPIMQQILFRLPAQDAVRMSFLSRTWKSLWNSLPVSRFNFYMVYEDGQDRKRNRWPEEFVTSVDESLRVLHEHEDQKRIVHFSLRGELNKKNQTSDINRWINLVIKHYVQELEILMLGGELTPRFSFPPASSDLGSLVVLRLYCCDISNEALKQEGMRFSCLKELSLVNADLNGLTNELLSRCPSIEALKFNCCKNVDLQLCGFSKLKTVELYSVTVYRYKIDASSLQNLCYSVPNVPLELKAINCSNLKVLIMQTSWHAITHQYIATLLLKFPFLEKLSLEGPYVSRALKILSHKLEELTLDFEGNTTVKKISIETPNLVSYAYSGDKFQHSFSLKSTKLENVDLCATPKSTSAIGTSWFLQLRQYLLKFNSKEGVVFKFYSPSVIRFAGVELKEDTIPPVSKILYLEVVVTGCSIDYTGLIDGLLWSCHPITLCISSIGKELAIKDLYKKLMSYRKKNLLCCEDNHIKCWRHYLKSVEIESFRGIKDGKPVYGGEGLARPGLLRNLDEVSMITLELQWY